MSTPLHPIIVHFPIVMLLLGAAAQIIAIWKPDFFEKMANYLLVGGFITGVAAYMTGDGAEEYAEANLNAARGLIHTHENLALLSLAVFGLAIVLKYFRYRRPNFKILTPVLLACIIAGAGLISVTGHYGGKIVYPANVTDQNTTNDQNNGDRD
ncbi:DUF2231 domain-containing protein [Ferviditalea candida]|uniref:DUF2231 domain-containing protein n=1 Tax=Ferviditalea candida TaxID=3108399 RepID=A0ABU5ZKK6_9BACL|nr:DUF2231 domain-containing protein [Paenibacillaceae bacterium T2]